MALPREMASAPAVAANPRRIRRLLTPKSCGAKWFFWCCMTWSTLSMSSPQAYRCCFESLVSDAHPFVEETEVPKRPNDGWTERLRPLPGEAVVADCPALRGGADEAHSAVPIREALRDVGGFGHHLRQRVGVHQRKPRALAERGW